MILVDPVQQGATPWPGGRFSHLISDESVEELLAFARGIGLSMRWFQHQGVSSFPHFDVSPRYRAKAIAAGANSCDKRGFVEAMRRYRSRNAGPWTAPLSR